MSILDQSGHLTPACRLLLGAVSRLPDRSLRDPVVMHRKGNWLYFPWYLERKGGGAFVLGKRIYVSGNFFDAHGQLRVDRERHQALLLLAHEVGHLQHAALFPFTVLGKTRFILWALGIYCHSYIRHGSNGYRRSWIEQEAERGRWVLRELIAAITDAEKTSLFDALSNNREEEMRTWLEVHGELLDRLHNSYPGW